MFKARFGWPGAGWVRWSAAVSVAGGSDGFDFVRAYAWPDAGDPAGSLFGVVARFAVALPTGHAGRAAGRRRDDVVDVPDRGFAPRGAAVLVAGADEATLPGAEVTPLAFHGDQLTVPGCRKSRRSQRGARSPSVSPPASVPSARARAMPVGMGP